MLIFLELLEEEDREDFRKIYERNRLKMYHVAYSRLKHQADAENAVHDSFVKLAEHYERYKHLDPEEMASLCLTIVKNKAIDILRRKNRIAGREVEDEMSELAPLSEPDILLQILEKEDARLLKEKMSVLSESLRSVLILKYFQGFKNNEIARILDISPRAVEMRLHRAKIKLKEELKHDRENI